MLNNLLEQWRNPWFPKPYIQIGSVRIMYYALCLVCGILLSTLMAKILFKKRGINPDFLVDLLIIVVPIAIVGARLWWVVCDLEQVDTFWDAFKIWNGGISILGALVFGALGVFIACKIHKQDFMQVADIAATVVPLGQCLGRWGNFFNGEVYGQITSVKWFPYSVPILNHGVTEYHVALFFRESVIDFLIFALLFTFLMFYKGKRKGYALSAYVFLYCLTRSIQEAMRDGEFNMSWGKELPYMSIVCIIASVIALVFLIILIVKDVKEKNYWWKDFFKKDKKEN